MDKVAKIAVIVVIILAVSVSALSLRTAISENKSLKIGAILPLSGPSSVLAGWIRNGMDMAKEDLAAEGIKVEIVYEDSQGSATQGITSYNKLKNIDDADVIVSTFSRVSIPLVPLADESQTPLIMTIVAAEGVAKNSLYAFRFYSTARQYANPDFFELIVAKEKQAILAILYINDEYGASVAEVIRQRAREKGIELVAEEVFDPGASDFRTQITKINSKNPGAFMFVAAVPIEVINIVTQARDMGITADIFEASLVLSVKQNIESAGEAAEGVYTNIFPCDLGLTCEQFKLRYMEKYGTEANFYAAFGYDTVRLVAKATGGSPLSGEEIANRIIALKEFESLNGKVQIKENREINPLLYSARIINGEPAALNYNR